MPLYTVARTYQIRSISREGTKKDGSDYYCLTARLPLDHPDYNAFNEVQFVVGTEEARKFKVGDELLVTIQHLG